jgi:multidrug efflux system outer membrane protein
VTWLALLSLGACSMDPHLGPVPVPVPASWPEGDAYLRQNEARLPSYTYQDVFRDARLQALVAQARVNNRDLMVAAANIEAARAQVTITRANQFPQLDANGKGTISGGGGGSGTQQNYSASLSIPSFELDIFGRLASLTRADRQRFLGTEAAARAVRLGLIADIADAWVSYAADSSLLQIAEDTAASAQKSVNLTSARLTGGIAPRTDLLQAQQVLETARQDLAQQRSLRARDVNLLQLLVGAPFDPALLPASIDQAGATIAALPAGMDSRVLLRRPDVVQSEYDLYAANAEIGAARAALFPTISLTGLLGLASTSLLGLFSGGAFNWSAGAGANYSIFHAGAGRANVALSQARRDAALASYQKAIQSAFREVADALADRGTMIERVRAVTANVAAASDTLRLIDARYRGGIDPYLTTLDAQRSLYSAQRSRVAVELAEAENKIALYRALGADQLIAYGPPTP